MDERIRLIKEKIEFYKKETEYLQDLIGRINDGNPIGFKNELDLVEDTLFDDHYDLKYPRRFYELPTKSGLEEFTYKPIIGKLH